MPARTGSPRPEAAAISARQQHVHHLPAVARLLHVGDLAAAAMGDAVVAGIGSDNGDYQSQILVLASSPSPGGGDIRELSILESPDAIGAALQEPHRTVGDDRDVSRHGAATREVECHPATSARAGIADSGASARSQRSRSRRNTPP